MRYFYEYETSIGFINISERDGKIDGMSFGKYKKSALAERKESPLIKVAWGQLHEYFNGKRKSFDIPLIMKGTPFQISVWNVLKSIPYGATRSYKDIAETVGVPKGFRAVGLANNKNPISVIIPCHRVIGADGKLAGYGGGINIKKYLLELEEKHL